MPDTTLDPLDLSNIPARKDLTPRLTVPLVAALLQKNYSQVSIGRYCGVSKQAVNQFLHTHKDELIVLLDYDNIIPRMLKHRVYEIVNSIDASDIKKASLQSKVTSAAIAIEKHRLIEGESTQNIDIQAVDSDISGLRAKREALQAELNSLQTVEVEATVEDTSDD